MEEILELKSYLLKKDYDAALSIVEEMEEMSRDDKINKIESFLEILLIHLITQEVEKRSTRSWEVSIKNAVDNVNRTNKRRKAGGSYLTDTELFEALEEAFRFAVRRASLEALEGRFAEQELLEKFDSNRVKKKAFSLLQENR